VPERLTERVEKLCKRVREFERSGESGTRTLGHTIDPDQAIRSAQKIGSLQLICDTVSQVTLPNLRNLADQIRTKAKRSVLALFSKQDSKVHIVIALTDDLLTTKLDAKVLAQAAALNLEGSAGGRKDLAQGGGRKADGIEQAVETLVKLIRKTVN